MAPPPDHTVPHFQLPEHLKPAGPSGAEILGRERARASFSKDELSTYLFGQDFLDQQKRIVTILENDPILDKRSIYYLGRTDLFRWSLRKEKRLQQLQREHNWSREDLLLADTYTDVPGPFNLHRTMFIATLEKMATDEQRKLYLEPALNNRIIGCYAQTELAHGSNVQGLETTATWIEADQQFDIHSPSLTASKWWIGGLGRTADHAILMAQLIINGQRKGPHPFIVQIRDVQTREILPGRLIGDIGPKAGYAGVDNGFMLFDHVRVPHVAMLAKLSRLEPESGLYHPPANPALNYGTLSWVRANIVQQASKVHMRAVTVAIRYCAIRRQFADRDHPLYENGKPLETPVLDYTMVQVRIFPLLARAFAFHYTAKYMFELFHRNQANVEKGDLSLLADMHATSSGLKSYTSIASAQAIEDCRRACGGHGFSLAAGLPTQYANYLPTVTWEGDSYMLSQQVSRTLFKTMRALKAGKGPSEDTVTTDYIKRYLRSPAESSSVKYTGDLLDPLFFARAFGHRAAFLTERALILRDEHKRSWNELLVEMFHMSRAHSEYVVIRQFGFAILNDEDLNSRPAIRNVMQQLFLLYASHTMVEEGADFLASGFINPEQFALLRSTVQKSMAELRPNAVALVDSFALPDYLLNSVLGRSDGKVYESLFDFALREPLNAVKWNVDMDDLETLDIEKAERSKL
ncbi:hypothetical protein CF327_g6434 [Tilletia walkeri]|uniref:Acyl-coenzyme A oxidase n=1 Tax=Tilletia walkeri TaxID=117179 RepID=A0A8X7T3G3_9BASI|nr:hypothetical protein CF327_g6434 [Tilletia walkeri]KAE8266298.1 hypothetical protein A4X09_0g6045 [Tilletia walkeri]